MATEAQIRASAKYDKNNTRSILLKLNTTTDADILAKLDETSNRQGYVKDLVRADIKGKGTVLSFDAIRLMIIPIIKKYKIKKAYLFGSYARSEAKPDSDLDFLIEGGECKTIADYLKLSEQLSQKFGKNVDVISVETVNKDKSRSGQRLRSHIERDKVLVYEEI